MFPKNIQFSATPLLLQQAVDGIQEPRGRLRRRKSKELAFKEKILQIPTEQLQKWKMKFQIFGSEKFRAKLIRNQSQNL